MLGELELAERLLEDGLADTRGVLGRRLQQTRSGQIIDLSRYAW